MMYSAMRKRLFTWCSWFAAELGVHAAHPHLPGAAAAVGRRVVACGRIGLGRVENCKNMYLEIVLTDIAAA